MLHRNVLQTGKTPQKKDKGEGVGEGIERKEKGFAAGSVE